MTKTPADDIPRAQKAAMVVQYLLREGKDLPLASLTEEVQLRLTRELGALKLVDKSTLNSVAREFAEELGNVALTVPGSVERAMSSLDGKLSPEAIQKLREEAAARQGANPWSQVLALENDKLLNILQTESIEVGAVLLSKLPTGKAAELLGLLPGELARRIAYAVSRTANILPGAVARIGRALSAQYCSAAAPAFLQPPSQRIGAILNSSGAETRDRLLEDLGNEDAAFADDVRKSIFTFADVPARLDKMDVPKVIRDIDADDMLLALAAATAEGGPLLTAAEHFLENMSKRMAEGLREEIKEAGKIKKADGEAAQSRAVAAIRAAADAGTITLIEEDDA